MSDPIQIQYDTIQQVGTKFQQQSDKVTETITILQTRLNRLQYSWEGEASVAFFREMNRSLLPGMKRLEQALKDAAYIANKIASVIRQAEEEAESLFKIDKFTQTPLSKHSSYASETYTFRINNQIDTSPTEPPPTVEIEPTLVPTPEDTSTPSAPPPTAIPTEIPPNSLGNNQDEPVGWGANSDLHGVLSWAGVVIPLFPDLINGILYAQEGNNDQAWQSFISIAPIIGDLIPAIRRAEKLQEFLEGIESAHGILANLVDALNAGRVPADLLDQLVAGIIDNGADPARGIPFAPVNRYDETFPFAERLAHMETLMEQAEATMVANPQWVGSQRLAWEYALLMQERGEALVFIPGLFRYNPDSEYSMYLFSGTYEQYHLWPEEFGGPNNGWAIYSYELPETSQPVIREFLYSYIANEMADAQINPVEYYLNKHGYEEIPWPMTIYDVMGEYAYDHPNLTQRWLRDFWTDMGVLYPY